jgi:hypothetical protein
MAAEPAETEIDELIKNLRGRLEQAAAVARLAQSCIDGGSAMQALTVVLDAEQPIQEATAFLNAANLINRRVIA